MTVQYVDTPNVNLAYETFGDANNPAIVMIHGLGTQMIGWQDAFLQSIADEGYFVVRFDNRDIGLSTHLSDAGTPGLAQFMAKEPVTESAYRLADMADDVAGKRQRRRSPARAWLSTRVWGTIFPKRCGPSSCTRSPRSHNRHVTLSNSTV